MKRIALIILSMVVAILVGASSRAQTVPPSILPAPIAVKGLSPVSVSSNTASIEWLADREGLMNIQYDIQSPVRESASIVAGKLVGLRDGLMVYQANIGGLQNATTYYYQLLVADSTTSSGWRTVNADFSYLSRFATLTNERDFTKRVSYWWGKVNQHIENGVWKTDPDGTSGANLDKFAYCQKWYPGTTAVADYRFETIFDWKSAGNTGGYVGTHMTYQCLAGTSGTPDLVVADFSWLPVEPKTTDVDPYLYVDLTVKNIGTAPVSLNGVSYGVYFGANGVLIGEVTAEKNQPTLDPGQSYTYRRATTMQNSEVKKRSGSFMLAVKADSKNIISESNEDNNTLSKTIFVGGGQETSKPDLVIAHLYVDQSNPQYAGYPFDSANTQVLVENQGMSSAGPFDVWLYVMDAQNRQIQCGSALRIEGLDSGKRIAVPFDNHFIFTQCANLEAKQYYVRAVADDASMGVNRVIESDETNNSAESTVFTVLSKSQAPVIRDIHVSQSGSYAANISFKVSQQVNASVYWGVTDHGVEPAQGTAYSNRISATYVPEKDLHWVELPIIPGRTYRYQIIIESTNVKSDHQSFIARGGVKPDFTVEKIFVRQSSDYDPSPAIVVRFKNQGGEAPALMLGATVVDQETNMVYSQSQGGGVFPAGSTGEIQMAQLLKLNKHGKYRLKAIIDSDQVFGESNEKNNTREEKVELKKAKDVEVVSFGRVAGVYQVGVANTFKIVYRNNGGEAIKTTRTIGSIKQIDHNSTIPDREINLKPRSSMEEEFTVTFLEPGEQGMKVMIDSPNVIDEYNESNNYKKIEFSVAGESVPTLPPVIDTPPVMNTHQNSTESNDQLVKEDGKSEIYVVRGGKRQHIPSLKMLLAHFRTNQVKKVTHKELERYPAASSVAFDPADADEDGLTLEQEQKYRTNPNMADSDGDGYLDGEEVVNGFNPMGKGRL